MSAIYSLLIAWVRSTAGDAVGSWSNKRCLLVHFRGSFIPVKAVSNHHWQWI